MLQVQELRLEPVFDYNEGAERSWKDRLVHSRLLCVARSESDSFTSLSHASLVNRGQIRDDMWTLSKFDYTSRRRYSRYFREMK